MPDEPIVNPVRPPIPSQPLPEAPLAGTSVAAAGVTGQSNVSFGVMGQSVGPAGSIGSAIAVSDGVYGIGMNGVHGVANTGQTNAQGLGNSGVLGENVNTGSGGNGGNGVSGVSSNGNGVYGQTGADGVSDPQTLSQFSGVRGVHLSNGPGVTGFAAGTGPGVLAVSVASYGLVVEGATAVGAARFIGDVVVNGSITPQDVILTGADCAEQFDSAESQELEPGTVVVIDQNGALRESNMSYDRKVAGVVSGAGGYKPAIVMDGQPSAAGRALVAMVGKVYCKVDARYASIEVGDLLTASPTPGHAMAATDPAKSFGAVIGKALSAISSGRGLIPILVSLQ